MFSEGPSLFRRAFARRTSLANKKYTSSKSGRHIYMNKVLQDKVLNTITFLSDQIDNLDVQA